MDSTEDLMHMGRPQEIVQISETISEKTNVPAEEVQAALQYALRELQGTLGNITMELRGNTMLLGEVFQLASETDKKIDAVLAQSSETQDSIDEVLRRLDGMERGLDISYRKFIGKYSDPTKLDFNRLKVISRLQRQRTIVASGFGVRYDPELYVSRQQEESVYSKFMGDVGMSDRNVFLVLGNAGLGKTWFLARMSHVSLEMGSPTFYVPLSHGIKALTSVFQVETIPALVDLIDPVLDQAGEHAFIFLDGLDEMDPRHIRHILGALSTARSNSVSFVLSCRASDWTSNRAIVQGANELKYYIYANKDAEAPARALRINTPVSVLMAEFTDGELRAAMKRYGLPDEVPFDLLPLMTRPYILRLSAEWFAHVGSLPSPSSPEFLDLFAGGPEYTDSVFRRLGFDIIRLHMHYDYIDAVYLDNFYIRKHVSIEPTHGDWSIEEPSDWLERWHHDCSNITAFNGIADDSWYSNPTIHIDGEIASSGSYIYPSDYGTGWDKHGPMQYHSFTSPILMNQLVSFEAELEIDTLVAAEYGSISVMLFDQYNNMSLQVSIGDSWSGENEVTARAAYTFENQSLAVTTPTGLYTFSVEEPYKETLRVIQNSTGLFAFIPRVGNFSLLENDLVESHRQIASIAVHFRADTDLPDLNVARIHDIKLVYKSYGQSEPESPTPSISNPDDIEYEAGTTGHSIAWTTHNFTPITYELYRDETLWNSATLETSEINISVDGLDPGIYNYSVKVYGSDDAILTNSVFVTVVDTTAPTSSSPQDIQYIESETGNSITWTASDLYPATYEIKRNGTLIQSGEWNITSSSVILSVDGYTTGVYVLEITLVDESGNFESDVVIVTVLPSAFSGILGNISFIITIGSVVVIVIIAGAICRGRGGSSGGEYDYG